jgi:hypothetical protein
MNSSAHTKRGEGNEELSASGLIKALATLGWVRRATWVCLRPPKVRCLTLEVPASPCRRLESGSINELASTPCFTDQLRKGLEMVPLRWW